MGQLLPSAVFCFSVRYLGDAEERSVRKSQAGSNSGLELRAPRPLLSSRWPCPLSAHCGWTIVAARADLDVIARNLAAQYPENQGFGIHAIPLREAVAGSIRAHLLITFGAICLVLILATLNVAHFHIVRLVTCSAATSPLRLIHKLGFPSSNSLSTTCCGVCLCSRRR